MSQNKELPDQNKIPSIFDSIERRHILPVSVLNQLTSLVQEKKDLFVLQIIKEGLRSTPTHFSKMEAAGNIDDGSFSSDCVQDAGQHEDEEKDEKTEKLLEGKQKSKKNIKVGLSLTSRDKDTVKIKKERPNYFVAVQITNPEIYDVAKKIQAGIQGIMKVNLRSAIIGVEKFHITIMVMHLPNQDEVKKAAESLEKCVPIILEKTCGQLITLDFEGLSVFNGGRVLFASLKGTEGLDRLQYLADEVSTQMKNNGIVTTDKAGKKFNPHLTLIKFEGDRELLRKGIRKVEASQYDPYINEVFGTQTIGSLQLCHMDKKREDGYYLVEHEVLFNK